MRFCTCWERLTTSGFCEGGSRIPWRFLDSSRKDLWVSATATLKLRNIKSLPEVCRRECEAAELRLSNGRFKVGDVDDYEDGSGTGQLSS